jgi:hypothetical protein
MQVHDDAVLAKDAREGVYAKVAVREEFHVTRHARRAPRR